MTTIELLARLRRLHIQIWAEGDRLRFQAPKGALTAELREALAARKAEVLALLQEASTVTQDASAPIPRGQHDGKLPLSFAQQRLWFLNQMEPSSPLYNIPSAVRLTGQIDIGALQRSFDAIAERHAALRTTFTTVDGQPVQVIALPAPVAMPLIDLRDLPADRREAAARELARTEAQTPFDLERGPLLRVKLLQMEETEYVVLFTMHHVISDGWSIGVVIRELATLYLAFASDRPSPLPELPIQYVDFAVWQRQWLQDQVLDQQLAYWKQQLHGAPAALELPTDRPRPPAQTLVGATMPFTIPPALTQALNAVSQREGATLFMALLAAFNTLLFRYSGQTDILIGSPIANRTREELEGLIGVFVNTLVLRTDLSGQPTFAELLDRVRKAVLGAFAHQDLPFERLVEALRPARDLSRTPLFQVALALQNAPSEAVELPGLTLQPIAVDSGTAKFDLTMSLGELAGGLAGIVEYNTDLFDHVTIARMLAHFQTLLEGIVAAPHQPIDRLPLLTTAEQQQILHEWNNTALDLPQDRCLHHLVEKRAVRHPDALAVSAEDGSLTYRQLDRRANQLAHHLQRLGVGPDVCVGLLLARSPDVVIGALGVLKAGGAYLPLDPAYPAERIQFMLADAQTPVLLTQSRLPQVVPSHELRTICLDTDWSMIAQQPETPPPCIAATDHLAYVIYTSGSTGIPKGVGVPHQGVLNLVTWHQRAYNVMPDDRATLLAGLAFDASVWEIWPYLASGASLHLPADEIRAAPAALVEWLIAQEISLCFMPTPLAEAVIAEPSAARLRLRALLTGGDLLHAQEWSRLAFPVINHYGPTENTVVTTCGTVEDRGAALPTIGRPIANTQVYVLDAQLQPAPIGVAGELYIGGESLARGYLNRPALTAEKFVPDPFSQTRNPQGGARLYRSGDLARYLADGTIEFLGRIDQQVKIRGFRIELPEIEAVLLRHPMVREAVVLAREDQGDKRLVAYVVENQEQSREQELGNELKGFLRQHLPEYMIPSAFVVLDELPVTPNGKVDRKALPAPDTARSELTDSYVAPGTPTEEVLATIWAGVLQIERVGIHDNFFELGGHSLLATQLVSRMRDAFQRDVPLREVFAAPTVAAMAQVVAAMLVDDRPQDDAPPLRPVDRTQPLPLSFSQERLWFLDQLEPDSSLYNIPSVLRVAGHLDDSAFEQSINAMISRHEILRTTFTLVEGRPVQVIAPPTPVALPCMDLRDLPANEREAAARELAIRETEQPFDLAHGPLLRVKRLLLDDTESMVLFTMHHIIADGWSIGVIVDELGQLYSAFSRGEQPNLPDLSVQYADYAVWQRDWFQGEVLDRQMRYWKQQLGNESSRGAVPLLDLPTDRPRPAVMTYGGRSIPFTLPQPLTDALVALSQREQVTPFMALLAAFNTLLFRYTGQDDIAIGTPIANRNRREIEPLIGCFINTLVLRTDLSGAPSFRELLARARQTTLGAYDHQDLPFEALVEALQPTRQLSHNPIFQVMFVMQNTPVQALELPNARFSMVDLEARTAKTDLTLEMVPVGEKLLGSFAYNTDLFDQPTIERMLTHFVALLEGVVADPSAPISRVSLLSAGEHQQMLIDWNQSAAEYPREAAVHQLIEAQAERTPNTAAIVFEGASFTYAELNARANQLAHYLRAQGVGPDVLVALCVERSLEMIVGMLAILKAGGAYVPLDPAYPAERVRYMLAHSGAPVIVTQAPLVARLPEHQAQVFCLDADWERLASYPASNPLCTALPDHLAYIIFTSGSTGRPKGVMVKQQGLINLVYGLRAYFADPTVAITGLITSISFDISVNQIFPTLIFGRTLHIIPDAVKFNSRALLRYLDDHQIHLLDAVPSYVQAVLNEVAPEQPPNALRYFLIGGEKIEQRLLQSVFGQLGSTMEIVNIYGLTEISDINILGGIRAEDVGKPITVGRPLQNNRIYILDRFNQPQPVGIAGEVCVAGESVSRGYLFRPELTAERFVACPFEDGQLMVRTGDLGRWRSDGTVEILGRIDQQVKVRGFRIETGEIEAVLATHPSVNECVVVVREDSQGDKRLVGYVAPREGMAEPTTSELRQLLGAELPDYMIPAMFVILPALPKTPSGKIDRTVLPAPELQSAIDETFVAPENPIEELLANIWAGVLQIERVGVYDNFFELGGHSLLATQLVSRMRDAFQRDVPLREVFAAPTVAAMAQVVAAMLVDDRPQDDAPPLRPVDRTQPLPLSFAQQRLWFLDQLEPDSPLYNIPTGVRLRGKLDLEALRRSIDILTERHESLRTTFAAVDGQPVQIVAPVAEIPLATVDLRDLPADEREAAARELADREAHRPFDLECGPLARVLLAILDANEYILVFTLHHIISDGWSMVVLISEWTTVYTAVARERPVVLPELPVQYADYAVWQRDWFQGPLMEQQLAYWKNQLRDAPAALDLPTDRPRPPIQSFRGALESFTLSHALTQALQTLSQRENATLFMTLLAAFNTLLFRYTGQDDISVGSPIANRTRSEIEGLIGFFVNTLVLRADLSGNPAFTELLARVRQVSLDAFARQDLPFEYLVESIQPDRDLSRSPLFQVMLVLQNAPGEAPNLPDLTMSALGVHSRTAKFDLLLSLVELPDGLTGDLEYNTDLFDRATIVRLLTHFETLLEGIAANPAQPISSLPLLTDADRQQQLIEWNATAAAYPALGVHQLVEQQASRTPDAVAVVFGDRHLTYRDLESRANQLARHLRVLGVGADARVGLCMERSLELVVGILGILKAGGCYVPLDPYYPAERLTLMLNDAEAQVVLTAPSQLADQRAMLEDRFAGVMIDLVSDWAAISQQPTHTLNIAVDLDQLAYVLYTSGSTGVPKGVAMPHRPLVNLMVWQQAEIPGAARTLQFASPSFDVSFQEIFTTWASGGTLVLPTEALRRDPEALAAFLDEQRIERLFMPFVALQQLAEALMTEGRVPLYLRDVITAGEQLQITPAITEWFRASPQCKLHNHYGPTETHVVTAHTLTGDPASWPALPPIGRPIANTQVYLLDRVGQPLPVGAIGDLYFGGDCVARGYLNRPELTAERFVTLEIEGAGSDRAVRVYKTGDLARYRPDGTLEFLGRADTQVKIRGFRIEPGEIENVLAQHAAVREAVVVVRPDANGGSRLVAYVVENKEQSEEQGNKGAKEQRTEGRQARGEGLAPSLHAFLKERLPDYMVPSAFVVLERWPLTPSGKIDRRALPAPDELASGTSNTFVSPRDTLELRLARIWESLLGVRAVGIRDNFFELGGHSLLVVRLMAQIQAQIGQKIPLATLFQEPTVEHLARSLRQLETGPLHTPLIALQPGRDRPPFFCVHPAAGSVLSYLELARLLGPDQPFYGFQAAGLEGKQSPHTRVEDMAAEYLAALQAEQPEGPYLLGGWSFGGLVAYEMARQLTAQGHEVALLALFDSWVPAPKADAPADQTELLLWFANDLSRTFGADLTVSPKTLAALAPEQRLPHVLNLARAAEILPPDISEREIRAYLDVFTASLHAMQAYQPQPYAGRVTLFRAGDQPLGDTKETLGWEALAADGVNLHVIPGDHYTIVRQPHVETLASHVRASLDEAQTVREAQATDG